MYTELSQSVNSIPPSSFDLFTETPQAIFGRQGPYCGHIGGVSLLQLFILQNQGMAA